MSVAEVISRPLTSTASTNGTAHQFEMHGKKATRFGFGEGLVVLGEKYENVVVLGGDITGSVMTSYFKEKFPDRFFSMGITEATATLVAAGLALSYLGLNFEKLAIVAGALSLGIGFGLQSIYGHLNEIKVKPGDMVKKGQIMGLSGATGLAGGDHLHFSMQIDGVQTNPVEWWDEHWIHDRILSKIGAQ